ncbi:hypothetical protein FRC10_005440, partial [Ceratobasidium sp. 414]
MGIVDDISLVYLNKDKLFHNGCADVLWVQTGMHLYILTDLHEGYIPTWLTSIKAWIKEYKVDPMVHDVSLAGPHPNWCCHAVWKALLAWDEEEGLSDSGVVVIDKGPLDLHGADGDDDGDDEGEGEEDQARGMGTGTGMGGDESNSGDKGDYKDDGESSDSSSDSDEGEDESGNEEGKGEGKGAGEGKGEGKGRVGEGKVEGGTEGDSRLAKKRRLEDEGKDGYEDTSDDVRACNRAKDPAPPLRLATHLRTQQWALASPRHKSS